MRFFIEKTTWTVLLVFCCMKMLSADAELLVYESFEYHLGGTVQPGGTLGGTEQGFTNAWLFTGYNGEIVSPLGFDGIESSGNALKITRNDGGSLFRGLDRQLPSGIYYTGMIFLRTDADNGGYENWSLQLKSDSSHASGSGSTSLLTVGATSLELASLKIGTGTAQTGTNAYVIGSPVFMLARFTISSNGEETASMKWYNPGDALPSDESTIVWDATVSGEFSGGSGWSLILPSYIGFMTIDEFRLGTELMDVIAGQQNRTAGDGDDDYQKVLSRTLLAVNRYRINTGDASNQFITADVSAGYTNGSQVILQNPNVKLQNQQWLLEQTSNDVYAIRCAYPSPGLYLCADPGDDGWSDGDLLQVRAWSNADGFLWVIHPLTNGMVSLQLQDLDLYLTRSSSMLGTPITVSAWTGSSEQTWMLDMRENVQSPYIVKGPDGSLLASFKYLSVNGNNGMLYASENEGKTWSLRHQFDEGVYGQTMFTLNDVLYMIYGSNTDPNTLKLAKSMDNGYSWSGSVIAEMSTNITSSGSAEVIHNGILYYAFTDSGGSTRGWDRFRLRVASCSIDQDLTETGKWTVTEPMAFPVLPAVSRTVGGWLEPCCAVGPDGKIWVVARVDSIDTGDVAAILKVSDDRTQLEFENQYPAPGTETGFMDAPWAGSSMFQILYDDVSQRYLAVSSPYMGAPAPNSSNPYVRNILALYESFDLKNFRLVKTLINDDALEDWVQSSWHTGFQYPAFIIDGDTLRYVSRTAYRTYRDYHDANCGTYHELKNFRQYLSPDGEIARYCFDNPEDPGYNSAKMRGSSANVYGAAYSASGKRGGCLSFNGADNWIGLMNRVPPKLHRAKQVSISVWIKPAVVSSPGAVYTAPIDGLAAGISLQLLYDKIMLSARSCVDDALQARRFDFNSDGAWHHLVALWDFENDTLRVWLDKTEQAGTDPVSFSRSEYTRRAPSVQDAIGCHYNGLNFFKGEMDELHIYSRALSQDEIDELFKAGTAQEGFLFQLMGRVPEGD